VARTDDHTRRLERLRHIAHLQDSRFRIPGTSIRFGYDSLIGLIPGIGDAATTLTAAYVVLEARRLGAPRLLVMRMVWNILVDAVIGAIPVLGDLADVVWKANRRNVELLERHLQR